MMPVTGHINGYVINGTVYLNADQLTNLLRKAGLHGEADGFEEAAARIRAAAR